MHETPYFQIVNAVSTNLSSQANSINLKVESLKAGSVQGIVYVTSGDQSVTPSIFEAALKNYCGGNSKCAGINVAGIKAERE